MFCTGAHDLPVETERWARPAIPRQHYLHVPKALIQYWRMRCMSCRVFKMILLFRESMNQEPCFQSGKIYV
jgi:hypothetical protein